MSEKEVDYESLGLCSHGKLPGLCAECLKTEEGRNRQKEVAEKSRNIGSELAKNLERETGIKPYDVVIVLGAGFKEPSPLTNLDRPPSDEGKRGWLLNHESRLRLEAAARLYLEGRARILLLTGGKGISEQWANQPSLAELGKEYLIKAFDIPEEDIEMETQSDATHGNLAYGMRELHQKGLPISSAVVISSEYHVERARRMAEESGILVDVVCAEGQLVGENPHFESYLKNWQDKVYSKKRLDAAEEMKMQYMAFPRR